MVILLACAQADLAQRLVPPTPPPPADRCDGFEVGRIHALGGAFTSVGVLPDGRRVAAAGDSLRVLRDGGTATILTEGEPADVLVAGERLWVADGPAGIAAWPAAADLEDPPDRWRVGGDVVALARSGQRVWAADARGRVLALALDARPEDAPLEIPIDGFPRRLAAWRDGVAVAAGEGGAFHATAAGAARLPTAGSCSAVASREDALWVACRRTLHLPGGATAELPGDAADLVTDPVGRLWAAFGHGGHARLAPDGTVAASGAAEANRLSVDGSAVWIGGGSGLFRLEGTDLRLVAEGGVVDDLAATGGTLAVAVRDREDRGVLWRLGALAEHSARDSHASSVELDGDHFLVTWELRGIERVPPAGPSRWIATGGGFLHGVALEHGVAGIRVGVAPERITWAPSGDGWVEIARRPIGTGQTPLALAGDRCAVAAQLGTLWCDDRPTVLLPSAGSFLLAFDRTAMAAFPAAWAGTLVVPLPAFGLAIVGDDVRRHPLPSGAYDAVASAEGVWLALGAAGIGRWDGTTVVDACGLPGRVHRIARDGDRLWVASGGLALELVPAVSPGAGTGPGTR